MAVLKDRNYRKYAIRKPINIKVIQLVNDWAKELTLKNMLKQINKTFISVVIF